MTQKNDRRVIRAWAFFDWANSAYSLVISTAVFPIYYMANTPDIISIGKWDMTNSSIYSFAVSASFILIALLSPILSGIADYSGRRKFFLKMFTFIGSVSCMALFFFSGVNALWIGLLAFMLATIGFSGSLVFYDSYLPEIASEDRMDKVSARGYAYGYAGSVILLIFILWMINQPSFFGFSDSGTSVRTGFALVGIWWLGFAQITFRGLPSDRTEKFGKEILLKGFREIRKVFGIVVSRKSLWIFLTGFFFMSAGVQTVVYLASTFAEKELRFEASELIMIILLLQIVAIAGAWLFAVISSKTSNKTGLLLAVSIWAAICVAAYFIQDKTQFYFLAGAVGMVLGGVQSLARSSYGKMIRGYQRDLTSFYSFYDVVFKVAIVMGTLVFGMVDQIMGGMRLSILALGIFFIIAFLLYSMVRFQPNGQAQTGLGSLPVTDGITEE